MHRLSVQDYTGSDHEFEFDGLLLDNDGTLTHGGQELAYEVWKSVFKKFDFPLPDLEVIRGYPGFELSHIFYDHIKNMHGAFDADRFLSQSIAMKAEAESMFLDEARARSNFAYYPDALEFVEEMVARNVRAAVVTNGRAEDIDVISPHLYAHFPAYHIITVDTFEKGKPDPAMMRSAVSTIEVQHPIVFGDSKTDIIPAAALGYPTVVLCRDGLDPQRVVPSEFMGRPDVIIVRSFADVTFKS